jgi:hypothetical protein
MGRGILMAARRRPEPRGQLEREYQQPPWVEHALDPIHWDLAFPTYRRGYHHEFDPLIVELNQRLDTFTSSTERASAAGLTDEVRGRDQVMGGRDRAA